MRPQKILLFIAGVLGVLAILCIVLPGRITIAGTEVRWPTLAQVFNDQTRVEEIEIPDELWELDNPIEPDTLASPSQQDSIPVTSAPPPTPPKVVVDSTTDSRIFLSRFYASLAQAGTRKVRVVHYGDSQIEADRMTQQIREGLQQRYGGSGVGLMPLAQTIPSQTVRQELHMNGHAVTPQQGPRRYLVYGPKQMQRTDGLYGPMGQVAIMADSLVKGSEDVTVICNPQTASAHYSTWRIFADSSIHYTISGDTVLFSGRGAVYGLSQETETGVIVDNIPMRGCLGTTIFAKIDSAQLTNFYRDENVQLIILQYGGNAIPSNDKPETIHGFVKSYRKQVRYLRQCAPDVDILFIGPSDMARMKDGDWQSYPMISYMDKLLRKMALEENIAYFSLYKYMGGAGSMIRWRENGLAGSDGVHFYRSGARKAGNAVLEWILEGINTTESSNDAAELHNDEIVE